MAGQLTIDTLKASSGVLATQNGMTGIAKAWVNYKATTQTIVNSFNVSSVTYNATGDFTINFTTAMPNANYVSLASASPYYGTANAYTPYLNTVNSGLAEQAPTTTAFRISTRDSTASGYNPVYLSVAILSS